MMFPNTLLKFFDKARLRESIIGKLRRKKNININRNQPEKIKKLNHKRKMYIQLLLFN